MQHIINAFHKLQVYWWYFWEYLRFADFASIKQSLQYAISDKCISKERKVRSRIGTFICRENTTDFMYINYNYERQVKSFIRKHLHQYDTFLDVGACIGDYSIWLGKQGYKCLTFEPVPANFKALQKNIGLNQLEGQVHSYQIGLGSQKETVDFEIRSHNKGASRMVREVEEIESDKTHDLGKIQPLDELKTELPLNKKDKVLMKLDVEGMEAEVIKGASQFIKDCNALILIIESSISDKESLIEILNTLGNFTYHPIDRHNFAAIKQNIGKNQVEYTQVEDIKQMNFVADQATTHTNGKVSVLDVGYGNGNMSMALGTQGHEVLGINISLRLSLMLRNVTLIPMFYLRQKMYKP